MALKSERLDNGLNIIVDNMPGSQVNNVSMFIPYGSVNEADGDEGMAHAFEHGVFLSTDKYPTEVELDRNAALRGMYTNANTYYTRTVYEANGINLDAPMDHLSQILQHTHFPDDMVTHEMKAVRREAMTGLDDVDEMHQVATENAMFGKPYGRDVIGYHDRLDFTGPKMRELHAREYKLGRMTLVVVGAAKLDDVVAVAERYFEADGDNRQWSPIELPTNYGAEHLTGLVRDDSSNVRISHAYPLTPEFRDKFNENRLLYGMAQRAISTVCFRAMRQERGISYNGYISFNLHNHPNAWYINGDVTTDAENIPIAHEVFDEVFGKAADSYDADDVEGALNSYKYAIASRASSDSKRMHTIITALQEYRQPKDNGATVREMNKIKPSDVRRAIGEIYEFTQSHEPYVHITGPAGAVSTVDKIIDQDDIA